MVSSFDIQNMRSLKKVTFGQDYGFDYLFNDGDIDWGSASTERSTYAYPNQVGVSISSRSIRTRDITISGYVYYVPDASDREVMSRDQLEKYVYEQLLAKKKVLNDLVNPLDTLRITIGDYYIEGEPNQSIRYGATIQENNEVFCRFMIDLYCNDPSFKKTTYSTAVISETVPLFRFPLILKRGEGIVMSTREDYNAVSVMNEGSMAVGGTITITAKDVLVNPKIINNSTGEFIKINKTLQSGEKVVINTNDGKEKGIIGTYNHETSNYFRYWDFESVWIKFGPGKTNVSYTTDNGADALLDLAIEINPKKLSLEEL